MCVTDMLEPVTHVCVTLTGSLQCLWNSNRVRNSLMSVNVTSSHTCLSTCERVWGACMSVTMTKSLYC